MQEVFQTAKVKKQRENTFRPFRSALEVMILSTAQSSGINAISSKTEVYGTGGQGRQGGKAGGKT